MFIFAAMLIPIGVAIILFAFFKHKTVWWEFLLPFALSIILVVIAKVGFSIGLARDIEYWTGWVKIANYYEDWNELVTYTETYTDSQGNIQTRVQTRVDYHPPRWNFVDNNGVRFNIRESTYKSFAAKFGNQNFEDLGRYHHGNDGDRYYTVYSPAVDPDGSKMEIVTSIHGYENRVAASDSVFTFEEVDPEEHKLIEYPKVRGWKSPSVLGHAVPGFQQADQRLCHVNAIRGNPQQIRIWILLYGPDSTLDTGYYQEQYWKGGNKNELVVCVGVNRDDEINWGKVFSWSESEEMKINIRNHIMDRAGEKLDLSGLIDNIELNAKAWKRKEFKDFNYITVDTPMWATATTFVIVLLANSILSLFIIHNRATDEPVPLTYRWRPSKWR